MTGTEELQEFTTGVADAIRSKTGSTDPMNPQDFAAAIYSISGGGGGSSAYEEVNHGTSDTTFELTPNTFHVWEEVSSLNLTLGAETSGVANEYLFQFTSGSTPTTLTLPDGIKWTNDTVPTISSNKIYQISILKGLGSVLEFEGGVGMITFYVDGITYQTEDGMTWRNWVESEYNFDNWEVVYDDTYSFHDIIHNNYWGTNYGTVAIFGDGIINADDMIINGYEYSTYESPVGGGVEPGPL